jgi:transposase
LVAEFAFMERSTRLMMSLSAARWLDRLVVEPAERDLKVDCRTVWSFVHAEKLSFKTVVGDKNPRTLST